MKIAFITVGAYMEQEDYANDNLLGTESQVFGLSKELVKKGHEVYIFRRWFESKVETVENVKIISFKSVNCKAGLKMTFYKLKFSREVTKCISRMKFDILVMLDQFTSFFSLKLPQPKITITHSEIPVGLLSFDEISAAGKIKYKLLNWMQRKLFGNSNVIVAINSTFKTYLEKKGYKTTLIPNAIVIDKYKPEFSNKKRILFGGRLVKAKRIDDLINAYASLNEGLRDDYKLSIMGFGAQKSYLEEVVKSHDLKGVEFIPWASSEEFTKKISECTVFVLPSHYETFGMVLIEAMALEKPVVASATYGPVDIIKNGYNGFLFEVGDVEKLSQHLQVLLDNVNLRSEIGKTARKTVENNYTFDMIADKYIKLFNEVLES